MTSGETSAPTDPFTDAQIANDSQTAADQLDPSNVLTVDRNATLTLGTDSLVLLDEGLRHRRAASNCCGLVHQRAKTTRAIPFYNVLWAELSGFEVTIHYALAAGKKACTVGCIVYDVTDKSLHAHTQRWVERLMRRAYPGSVKRRKRIKVLINPFGGKGHAQKVWVRAVEPLFAAARCEVEIEKTAYRGHAAEIAEKMKVDAYDVVACASGDGLPHEVFNGLARRSDARRALRRIAVAQLPCGSGNAMSLNLNGTDSPSLAALAIVKGTRTPLDLVAITQGRKRYYSFLSQAVGIVAESDLGTESLRWMGSFRFTWGILVRLLGQTLYPAEVSVVLESDDKRAIKETCRQAVANQRHKHIDELVEDEEDDANRNMPAPQLQFGTIQDHLDSRFQTQDMPTLGNFYAGNMCWMAADAPFFVASLPSDGRMDLINISGLCPRTTALRMLMTCGDGSLIDNSEVSYCKVRAYRITPRMSQTSPKRKWRVELERWLGGAGKQKEGLIAIDGERVPFEPFQAEVVQGLGTVLSKRHGAYEFDGLGEG